MEVGTAFLPVEQTAVRQSHRRRRTEPSEEAQRQQLGTKETHKRTAREQRADSHPTALQRLVFIEPVERILVITKTGEHKPERPHERREEQAYR